MEKGMERDREMERARMRAIRPDVRQREVGRGREREGEVERGRERKRGREREREVGRGRER